MAKPKARRERTSKARERVPTSPPRRQATTLDELLDQVTPDNRHDEVDWGPPVGKEVW